ncbi:hypothetical protein DNTS_007805, partial [Danionella cerebrum]
DRLEMRIFGACLILASLINSLGASLTLWLKEDGFGHRTGLWVNANDAGDMEGVRHRAPPIEMKLVGEEGSEVTLSRVMTVRQMGRRKTAAYLTLSALLIFSTAFLLGYVVFRGVCRVCANEGDLVPLSDAPAGDHPGTLERVVRVSRASHPPGSSEGNALAREILQNLQNLRMDHTWTDSHYATLQFPSRSQRNTLWLVDAEGAELEEIPLDSEAYCAYSATGTVTGGLVYVNYGRREDVLLLRQMGVDVNGAIAIVRVGGGVSFAEKVWFVQEAGFVGALIYPDPADVPQDPRRLGLHGNTVISEHVHLGSGDPFTPGFPSFNHTQFPSSQSSGLPTIPAQPISANVASKLLSQLSGATLCPRGWQGRLPYVECVLGPGFSGGSNRRLKMAVHNTMKPVLLNNIFGSIEGSVEPGEEP